MPLVSLTNRVVVKESIVPINYDWFQSPPIAYRALVYLSLPTSFIGPSTNTESPACYSFFDFQRFSAVNPLISQSALVQPTFEQLPVQPLIRNVSQLISAYQAGQETFGGLVLKAANLREAYLPFIGLEGANLEGADLRGAVLTGASLMRIRLQSARLDRVNFMGADLIRANLHKASIKDGLLLAANLCGADLSKAHLQRVSLAGANLNGADLRGADLTGANLSDASLFGTNLTGANLTDVPLDTAKLSHTIMPDGYCLVGENEIDDDPNKASVSIANISAYSRLAKHFRSF